MVEVVACDEFVDWYHKLDETDIEEVTRVVDMLEMLGPQLRFPYSSAIQAATTPYESFESSPKVDRFEFFTRLTPFDKPYF